MLHILSDALRTATRNEPPRKRAHWPENERFDNRKRATLEAHKLGQGNV